MDAELVVLYERCGCTRVARYEDGAPVTPFHPEFCDKHFEAMNPAHPVEEG